MARHSCRELRLRAGTRAPRSHCFVFSWTSAAAKRLSYSRPARCAAFLCCRGVGAEAEQIVFTVAAWPLCVWCVMCFSFTNYMSALLSPFVQLTPPLLPPSRDLRSARL
jgi:hypothetical protein